MPPIFSESTSLLTALDPATARERAELVLLRSLGGRRGESSDGWQTTDFGSAFGFRMLGLWSEKGERRLPLQVSTLVRSLADGSAIDIHIRRTEGPYLVVLPAVAVAYRRVVDRILTELVEATSAR